MTTVMDSVPLEFLRRGERAVVSHVMGESSERQRIAELGVQPGTEVQMVQVGEPCILRIDGARLCFRLTSTCRILVERRSR